MPTVWAFQHMVAFEVQVDGKPDIATAGVAIKLLSLMGWLELPFAHGVTSNKRCMTMEKTTQITEKANKVRSLFRSRVAINMFAIIKASVDVIPHLTFPFLKIVALRYVRRG